MTAPKISSKLLAIIVASLIGFLLLGFVIYLVIANQKPSFKQATGDGYEYVYSGGEFDLGKVYFGDNKARLPGIKIQDGEVGLEINYKIDEEYKSTYQIDPPQENRVTYRNVAKDTIQTLSTDLQALFERAKSYTKNITNEDIDNAIELSESTLNTAYYSQLNDEGIFVEDTDSQETKTEKYLTDATNKD